MDLSTGIPAFSARLKAASLDFHIDPSNKWRGLGGRRPAA